MSDQESAVVVKDLFKTFKLPHDQHSGIKQLIVNFHKRQKGYELQQVLNGISFEIKKGEFFGIVGRNGSGKSTLLKLLAGIYAPDNGLVQVNGSLTPFIELGVGFNPELTGRENVFLNGALLGFSRKEMDAMYGDIVEFAELEKFMDQKLKNYSSGMQVRLAFSIAIRAQSDILLLDEVLAVGDAAFQRKCYKYFETLKQNNKTVILVTHDMAAVEKFCSKAMLISKGEIKYIGDPYEIATQYTALNQEQTRDEKKTIQKAHPGLGSKAKIHEVRNLSDEKRPTNDVVSFNFDFETEYKDVVISVSIVRSDNVYVGGLNTLNEEKFSVGMNNLNCTIDTRSLLAGSYFINISIYDTKFTLLDFKSHGLYFNNGSKQDDRDGIINFPVKWSHE